MRKVFEEAHDRLKLSRYLSDQTANYTIVFGGELVCVAYHEGGSYSDNGGGGYSPAGLSLFARWYRPSCLKAVAAAKLSHPDIVDAFEKFPRSNAQAARLLQLAAELDQAALAALPAVEAELAAQEAASLAKLAAARAEKAFAEVAVDDLAPEVLRLLREGHLDGSNALAGLLGIARRLDALGGAAPAAEGATVTEPKSTEAFVGDPARVMVPIEAARVLAGYRTLSGFLQTMKYAVAVARFSQGTAVDERRIGDALEAIRNSL